jgi:hypothetical protein
MNFVRIVLVISSAAITAFTAVPALAQGKLATFVEANGCKLLGAESAVKRLQAIAAQGAVTWDGECKRGLIEGKGVLREEGTVTVGGKTRKYAYHLSGNAKKGIRTGQWRRETFDRFVDSPKFYTSAASIKFVNGVAKGRPKLVAVSRIDQLSPGFRKLVIDAQRDATPDNKALLQAAASPPPQPAVNPPAQPVASPPPQVVASPPPAAANPQPQPVATAPAVAQAARVTASSQLDKYGPEGLLAAAQPGWHAGSPPIYPEWVMVEFPLPREIKSLGILPQDDNAARAPKAIHIEMSTNGRIWNFVAAGDNTCAPKTPDGWSRFSFPKPVTTRYLRISIVSNCGEASLLTFRGLRFD